MKASHYICILALVSASAISTLAQSGKPVVVTASNTASNNLLVYDASGQQVATVPTGGAGGVSGNAGALPPKGHALPS